MTGLFSLRGGRSWRALRGNRLRDELFRCVLLVVFGELRQGPSLDHTREMVVYPAIYFYVSTKQSKKAELLLVRSSDLIRASANLVSLKQ